MKLNWGFIGAGRIAHRFMDGLLRYPDAVPYAVYARNAQQGQEFAGRYGMQKVFTSLEEFLACEEIDVVYVATPHSTHMEFAMQALRAKKPVLCEKPMTPNAQQMKQLIACARENNTFLMEAMWTRTFAITKQVRQWIAEGKIGKIVACNGAFCINPPKDMNDRLFRPDMAGGALMDVGPYLISYCHMLFGAAPSQIATLANLQNGVDMDGGVVLRFPEGELATLLFSFNTEGKDIFTIYGTQGMIEIFEDFWRPRHAKLTCPDGIVNFDCPVPQDTSVYGSTVSFAGEGYQFEVAHLHDCLQQGLKESPLMPLDESLQIISTCDAIRAQWGMVYPFEK